MTSFSFVHRAPMKIINPWVWMTAIINKDDHTENNAAAADTLSQSQRERDLLNMATSTMASSSVPPVSTAVSKESADDEDVLVVPGGTLWSSEASALVVSSDETGETRRLCFRNLTNEKLILCWVGTSSPSDLHHFYTLDPYKGGGGPLRPRLLRGRRQGRRGGNRRQRAILPSITITDQDHIETSEEGHAFLIVAADDIKAIQKNKSLTNEKPSKKRPLIQGEVRRIGAYRADPEGDGDDEEDEYDEDEETRLHLVEITDTGHIRNQKSTSWQTLRRSVGSWRPRQRKASSAPLELVKDEPLTAPSVNPRDRYVVSARWVIVKSQETLDTCKTKRYQASVLGQCCWPVQMEQNRSWSASKKKTFQQLLASDLDAMTQCLPAHAVTLLRDSSPTPIWVNRTFQYGPKCFPITATGMCFHPASDWLCKLKMHAEKCECVELYDVEDYAESRALWGAGGLLLHEFSHAYHHKACTDGYDNAEIAECYQAAMDQGLYDSVKVKGSQGPTARAYACTNAMEYFAELSTAFLGGVRHSDKRDDSQADFNKWYPHNRQQIREHDPRAYEMLKKIWKVEDEK